MEQKFNYQTGKKGRGLVLSRRIAYGVRAIIFSFTFFTERKALFGLAMPTTERPTQVMNDICNATNGAGLEKFSKLISFLAKKQTAEFDKTLESLKKEAKLSDSERAAIVASLRDFGFAKLQNFTSRDNALAIYDDIMKSPGRDRSGGEYKSQLEWLDKAESPRIDANRQSVTEAVNRQKLDFASLELISREYLNCRPIKLGPNSWTTKATKELSSSSLDANAMAFHSDSDYFGFVKAFLLLTEVDQTKGPFTFISGSHLGERQVQGRLSDSDLGYEEKEVCLGTGQPGDLVLAITTGWHKASVPTKGHRMMVQWLFTNSLFGSATQ